jgi:lipoyl(octanoyl) transferase
MRVTNLGTMRYRDAWAIQEQVHTRVLGGAEEELLLVEHPPVITLGRRAGDAIKNLVTPADQLERVGVELVESDRGGDITFHGPGQIVAYPIVRLNDHRLSVGGYVRTLEAAVIAALGDIGIIARREEGAVGIWVDTAAPNGAPVAAKVCAIGVRIRRGVSLHGLALNVTTNLDYFNLIVPCGLAGRPVTTVERLLGPHSPAAPIVREALVARMLQAFTPRPAVVGPSS